jgi:hypothetical protein
MAGSKLFVTIEFDCTRKTNFHANYKTSINYVTYWKRIKVRRMTPHLNDDFRKWQSRQFSSLGSSLDFRIRRSASSFNSNNLDTAQNIFFDFGHRKTSIVVTWKYWSKKLIRNQSYWSFSLLNGYFSHFFGTKLDHFITKTLFPNVKTL